MEYFRIALGEMRLAPREILFLRSKVDVDKSTTTYMTTNE